MHVLQKSYDKNKHQMYEFNLYVDQEARNYDNK